MISVLILTLNEERNLPRCLAALTCSDDVVVFDSGSQDGTSEIAKRWGARVYVRAFDTYSAQREAARTQVEYKHKWVLAVDADERPDPELQAECLRVGALSEEKYVAYRMRRKDYFMGRWIRGATLYPSWFIRLYRPDRIRYPDRAVHEYPEVSGEVGVLRGHLLHESFGKGLAEWIDKHNRYSSMEAHENLRSRQGESCRLRNVVSRDPVLRRRALKRLSVTLPARPLCRFIYMYGIRGGWRDGRPGLIYCLLLAWYELCIALKVEELKVMQGRTGGA